MNSVLEEKEYTARIIIIITRVNLFNNRNCNDITIRLS
jgi:hypothetical protein